MKIGSLVVAEGPRGVGAYVITDMPEHDPSVVRVAKSFVAPEGRWIRAKDVLDVVVY